MFKRLISLIFSIVLAAISTILFTFAWFTQNRSANASGISVSSLTNNISGGSINRYLAIENSDGTYSKGELLDQDNVVARPYDNNGIETYDKVIYELGCIVNKDSFSITLLNTDDTVTRYFTDDKTHGYVNYLSNVAEFSTLSSSDGINFSLSSDSSVSLPYIDDSARHGDKLTSVTVYKEENISKGKHVFVYLLFDYNKENINKLFSANLGSDANKIYFKEDLEFRIA